MNLPLKLDNFEVHIMHTCYNFQSTVYNFQEGLLKVGVSHRVHNCIEGMDKKISLIQAHLFLVYGYHQIRLICSLALFNQLQTFHEKQNYLTDTLKWDNLG